MAAVTTSTTSTSKGRTAVDAEKLVTKAMQFFPNLRVQKEELGGELQVHTTSFYQYTTSFY